jgi:multidrug resistance efflux pump
VSAQSAQKESRLALELLSLAATAVARLAAEVEALRSHSEGAQKQLAAREAKFGGLDRAEADTARVASAVGQRWGGIGALKNWTD